MTVSDLTLSKVGPSVEGLLRLMQSGGLVGEREGMRGEDEEDEKENQQQVQLAYLGSLGEMRAQLARMGLFYQDQLDILLSLTSLMDRIDEALSLVSKATQGYSREELGENEDGTLKREEEENILRQSQHLAASLHHSSLHQSLVVSTLHQSLVTQQILGISGILSKARLKAEGGEDDGDDDDSEWDQPLTEEELSQLDSLSPAPTNNLRQSFMENIPELEPAPIASSSKAKKNRKGKCEPTLCKICYDEFTEWCLLYTLSDCDHTYCKECFEGYLTTLITSGGVLDLGCPHPECDAEIDLVDIYAVCNKDTIDKYERFVVLAALRADPDVRWCPMNNCSAAIKGPPKDGSPWVVCGTCGLQVCFACGDERHDPVQCGKDARALIASRRATVQEAEDLFEAWHKGKATDVKACPKCRAFIEKNQGCNHMTCQSCKHQFCWLCLSLYEYNHFNNDKFPDCKGKQYWYPPVPPDPELQARYNWIYFPPNYQYADVDDGPAAIARERARERERERERVKTRAKKIGMYVGVGVAVATLGIPAVVIGGPIYGVFQLHKALKVRRRSKSIRR